jgi:glutamate--cysteine ligase
LQRCAFLGIELSVSTVRPLGIDDLGEPLVGTAALIDTFSSAEKPRSAHRVGTEHEKFGFMRVDRSPLPFDGPFGIETILRTIAKEKGWTPALEGGHVIALFHDDGSSITLEPGGQLELSGAPVHSVHDTCTEVGRHLALLKRVCVPLGVGFIGMGFHPTARWDQMPSVPKSRYAVMERYLPRVGARGLDMMKRTCTVQANFDWQNEPDFVAKYRTALAMQPFVAALFANSPFVEGKPSGALSERQRVWVDTDPVRSGFPACVFAADFGYARYVDWALDVPMFFVRRDGLHHDAHGTPFRSFLRNGLHGHRATLRDFHDHLTTLFPEVRAKKVLEVRAADGGPWSRIAALPALHKGVLYDAQALAQAWALFDEPRATELASLRSEVAVHGYRARYRDKDVLWWCERLLEISRSGLQRIATFDAEGRDESIYLAPLEASVSAGETFAEQLLRLWRDRWGQDIDRLWDEAAFFSADDNAMLPGPCA